MRRFETEPTARRASRKPDRGGRILLTLCLRARARIRPVAPISRANSASRARVLLPAHPKLSIRARTPSRMSQSVTRMFQNVPRMLQNAPQNTPERPRTLENDHRMLHNDARMTASGNIWECLRSSGASRRCVSACDLPSLRPGKSLRARPTSV